MGWSVRPKAIIIDLDGTLCNNEHRRHFVEGEEKDFEKFNAACVDDKVNQWCLELIKAMDAAGYRILFISGREYKFREQTWLWIVENAATKIDSNTDIYMRAIGDYRKDSVVKEEIYRRLIEPHFKVLFCVDDRQQVVDMWRSLGLTCLQCAKGDF